MKRFYCEDPLATRSATDEIRLSTEESHHLARVMRLGVGDVVEVFDGRGACADAVVAILGRGDVRVRLVDTPRICLPSKPLLTIAVAPPKADRFRTLVEKCVELGVERLMPITTARGVVEPGDNKLDRLRDTVIAACKQCGRNRLMDITPVTAWPRLLDEARSPDAGNLLLVADPGGISLRQLLATVGNAEPSTILAIVGPEGGLSPAELAEADAGGAIRLRLSNQILRTETAAIAVAAMLGSAFETTAPT
jgi:16S rRNA (uracil1498-N3)-methyltransferase